MIEIIKDILAVVILVLAFVAFTSLVVSTIIWLFTILGWLVVCFVAAILIVAFLPWAIARVSRSC